MTSRNAAWHAPRDAAQTPWYSLRGWLGLGSHNAGISRRQLLHATAALHARLPPDPADVSAPGSAELESARRRLHSLQMVSPSAQTLDATLQALEVVAKMACVTQGQRASLPQLLAALAMTQGYLIQLAPGEGKTLAVAIAAVLIAWTGKPLHIVTANDYLAERDAELMAPLYSACGLSVGSITGETPPHALAACYRHSMVYATAKQFLADYLRDDLLLGGARDPVRRRLWHLQNANAEKKPVMRGLSAVIIDEADGILIDEA
ncbi:MAG: hypothetical protein NTZ64_14835, partial [Polaromonas sp.]|nr:hypothetical protein [Polaromonas sp.]